MEIFGQDDEIESGELPQKARGPLVEVRRSLKGVGGGRGVFAVDAIEVGTLVLAEVPVEVWADAASLDDPDLLLQVIESILGHEEALAACKTLHPTSFAAADEGDRQRIASVWSDDDIEGLCRRALSRPTREEVLCIALALQHNGFASGLYSKLTLVNHSCRPNCIKFSPSSSTGWASEIWTTRPVQKGEELTICYSEPLEMTSAAMRAALLTHHRFECCCTKCLATADTRNAAPTAAAVEAAGLLSRLQDEAAMMEKELRYQKADGAVDILKTTRSMLTAAEGMIAAIVSTPEADPADRTGLLVRLHKLSANAAAALLEAFEEINRSGGTGEHKRVKSSIARDAASNFLLHSLALRDAQTALLGDCHPDLAGTLLDVDQGFALLLEGDLFAQPAARQAVLAELAARSYAWASGRALIKAEWARCKREGQRIKRLYARHPRFSSTVANLTFPGSFYLPAAASTESTGPLLL